MAVIDWSWVAAIMWLHTHNFLPWAAKRYGRPVKWVGARSEDFLAAVQVIVYVGGILVLIIFGVMLTNRLEKPSIDISSMKSAVLIKTSFRNLYHK